jgi:hypothetical protein
MLVINNFVSLTGIIIFVYWRNYCSIIQIKNFYNNSDVRFVINFITDKSKFLDNNIHQCQQKEKRERSPIQKLLIKIFPKKEKKLVEHILSLRYCLNNYDFLHYITNSLSKVNLNSQGFNSKQMQIINLDDDFESEVKPEPQYHSYTSESQFILYYKYLSNLMNELSSHSNILTHIKNGNYAIHPLETFKFEFNTRINKFIFTLKNKQNEIEYLIKQLFMETSHLYGLIIDYFYFIFWCITFTTTTLFIKIYNKTTAHLR